MLDGCESGAVVVYREENQVGQTDVVVLTWTFAPADFFEDSVGFDVCGHRIEIKTGHAVAHIPIESYSDQLEAELHQRLTHLFQGPVLVSHRPYSLERASIRRFESDGSEVVVIRPNSLRLNLRSTSPDLRVHDAEGNIVSDSRADRVERKRKLAARINHFLNRDTFLPILIASYEAAVRDPENELIHLYQIRNALMQRFRTTDKTRKKFVQDALGISSENWERFDELCNSNVKQGRHRGRFLNLRSASEDQLRFARLFAVELIEAYLDGIETPKNND